MNFIKYLLITSLFCSYLSPLQAQQSIEIDPENTPEVISYIYELYGEQIELSPEDVQNFIYEAVNFSNYDPECNYSPVEISEYEIDFLTFSWESPLEGVEYYEHRSLNLHTGEMSYESTDVGMANYNYNSGFFLFLFNSACSTTRVSRAQIIIVDKDVMLNGPPVLRNCICDNPIISGVPITAGPPVFPAGSSTVIYGHARFQWPLFSSCLYNKYIIEIEDTNTGYMASAFIVHEPSASPQNIYLHTSCSHNFSASNSSNVNPGDSGKYSLSFTIQQALVNIEDYSIFQNGSISIKQCSCNSSGRSKDLSTSKKVEDSLNLVFQNPVKNQMNLNLSIPHTGIIKYHFRDINGRQVGQMYTKEVVEGDNQIEISVTHLSAGIYNLITNYKGQRETRKVVKVN